MIGITPARSLDNAFLLLLLLALLAIARKAFLRHALRDRMKQQYDNLSQRIMLAKSIVYRLSVAAYGLPPPQYDQLPASCTQTVNACDVVCRFRRTRGFPSYFLHVFSHTGPSVVALHIREASLQL